MNNDLYEICVACDGEGKIPFEMPDGRFGKAGCPECRGTGKIRKGAGGYSDFDYSRRTFIEEPRSRKTW